MHSFFLRQESNKKRIRREEKKKRMIDDEPCSFCFELIIDKLSKSIIERFSDFYDLLVN